MAASLGGISQDDLAERVALLEETLAARQEVVQILRESEERFRTLLENSPDSITLLARDGTILYVNRTVPPRKVEDVIGTRGAAYMTESDGTLFQASIERVFDSGVAVEVEVEVQTAPRRRWFATRLVPVRREGRVIAVMGIGADVTDRRETEQALRRSEEMLRIAVESAKMGLWGWDARADAFTLDPVASKMLGFESAVVGIGLPEILARVSSADRPRAEAAARRFAETGQISDFEVSVTHPDGTQRWLVVSGTRTEESSVLIGGAFDITERKQLEEQLRQAQKMEAVGQLTAGIAHNFNNLLTAIIPSVQLARRELFGASAERLRDAEYAAGRAAELVKQLMVFARTRRRPVKERVDVRALVRRTAGICRATFDRAIEMHVTEGVDVPVVLGEAGQIEQVLLNVYLNARDALEDAATRDRVIRTHIDVTSDDRVCIRISDNGPGMPEAVRLRIFEPFYTTKEVGRGSGLGLATAYAIARDHEGMLSCSSAPGEGATFTLLLPASREPAPAVVAPRAGSLGGNETILVLDDERLVRTTVRSVLEPAGYRVLEAADGIAGFEVFQRHRGQVDLVLLDLSMPGVPGAAVLAMILRERPSTRVVVFTGQDPDSIPIGATAVVPKPVCVDELLRVVRDACDRAPGPTGLT